MPLATMTRLLAAARSGGYAVCYCESWNLESFQAVVSAAEEAKAPAITGFNGGFLAHRSRLKPENLAYYGGMVRALQETLVPVAFLLNETDDLAQISRGLAMGFNAVMVENERLAWDDYGRLVRTIVQSAHVMDVSVEAAVGRLPDASGGRPASGELTEPARAQRFVEETGIDALAVSVGNVHILTRGKAPIDLDALARIHDAVRVPLVLHGGTGVPLEQIRDCVRSGVAKVNFGTVLKQDYLTAVRGKLALYQEPFSPHPFLGMGGPEDVMVAGREAVKQRVLELLAACGSAGRAEGGERPGQ